jgi:16S rRNA (cytosine1402-N4)-methyltransferase
MSSGWSGTVASSLPPEPDDPPPAHRRRPRYRGTHPRSFDEKYKERAPELYPEMAGHVRQRGQTPAGQHVPILVEGVLEVLAPRPGERGVDATAGYGGHAERLLQRVAPGGQLLLLDVDPIELPKTEARLRALGHDERALVVRRSNFAGLAAALRDAGWSDGADFMLADLGVSSMQLDDPARGFTFRADAPLDMRMNPARGLSAAQWLARASVAELSAALKDHADEPHAERIARALVARAPSAAGPPATTRALADAVRAALAHVPGTPGTRGTSYAPSREARDEAIELSVRRVFQALRIEVNDELGALDALLRDLPGCLRRGGRVAFLTFHSGEDRRVKAAFRQGLRDGRWAAVAEDVIRASPGEQRSNPRSSSAKLRWARRP